MKTLILVRHAKSDWNDPTLDDFDRPLNERGKRDAPVMARRLREKHIRPDRILSSPAKRAARTARVFAEELDVKKKQVLYNEALYLAPPSVYYDVLSHLDRDCDTVALFAHNDGITAFANQLTDVRIDNIPTCGVFAVRIHCEDWSTFRDAQKDFWFFDQPKAL
ncbi:MAG: hypothetical protein RJA57_1670 [Bacteroidota bacterium]|jgi:phosphohistidine phosphatase